VRSRVLIKMSFIACTLIWISVVLAQSESDLGVSVTSNNDIVPINTNFTYQLTLQNLGADDATFVSVTDTLPLELLFLTSEDCSGLGAVVSCDIGDIGAGESVILDYQVRAITAGTALNTISVSGAETDPNLSNNNASLSVEIVMPEPVDLVISGSISPSEVDLSDLVDLSFVVSNGSIMPAYLTQVELVLPSQLEFVSSSHCSNAGAVVTCAIGTVTPETPVAVSISVRAVAAGKLVTVAGLVSHITSDLDTSNNGSSVAITIHDPPLDSADLQIGVATSATQFVVGQAVEFTFTIVNSGPAHASEVRIMSDLPDGLSFVSSSDCAVAGELLVCDIGDLVFNAVFTSTVQLQSTVVSPSITMLANVTSNAFDPNIINNIASISLPSIDLKQATATLTNTPLSTPTPIVLTATPGPSQTPYTLIVTQPVFLTELPQSDGSQTDNVNIGSGIDLGIDILPDGVAPSDIYGWTRYESIDLIPVTGRWVLRSMQNASDGAYHESRDSGAILRFPFEGEGFRIGYRSEVHGGSFQMMLDGAFLTVYETDMQAIDPDLNPARQTFVTQAHWVTPGYHVIDIVCLSDGQGAQGCNIDYIEIFVGPPIPIAPTIVAVPTQAIVVEHVELIAAPPTLAPTAIPTSDSVMAVDVFVTVDLNTNQQVEPNEGVVGMSIQAVDVSNNTTLATSLTDESGFVRIRVATGNDVVLLIPMLGESFYVHNRGQDLTEIWTLMLDPANVPGLIP
jgi:uncharacterized repeat protein (TIGR01451 family)